MNIISRKTRTDEWGPDFDASAGEVLLQELVKNGPMLVTEIHRIADEKGVTNAMLRRAKANLRLIALKPNGFNGQVWATEDWGLTYTAEEYPGAVEFKNWSFVRRIERLHQARDYNPLSMFYEHKKSNSGRGGG